jgi:hypothetical protein
MHSDGIGKGSYDGRYHPAELFIVGGGFVVTTMMMMIMAVTMKVKVRALCVVGCFEY